MDWDNTSGEGVLAHECLDNQGLGRGPPSEEAAHTRPKNSLEDAAHESEALKMDKETSGENRCKRHDEGETRADGPRSQLL